MLWWAIIKILTLPMTLYFGTCFFVVVLKGIIWACANFYPLNCIHRQHLTKQYVLATYKLHTESGIWDIIACMNF